MLETSEERIRLLRLGFNSTEIERLYVKYNQFKMVYAPRLIDLVEIDILQNRIICIANKLHNGLINCADISIFDTTFLSQNCTISPAFYRKIDRKD